MKKAPKKKNVEEDGENVGKVPKTRVALGIVRKSITNAPTPFKSLADADTDDEEDVKPAVSKLKARPRRSLRLAAAHNGDSLPDQVTTGASSLTTTGKATKKTTKTKRVASASSTVTAAAGGSTRTTSSSSTSGSASSKAKKLALANHTAAVVAAAVEAQEQALSTQMLAPASASSSDVVNVMRVSPFKPTRRSPRTSMPSTSIIASVPSSLNTLAGGVRAFEVFSPSSSLEKGKTTVSPADIPLPSSSLSPSPFEGGKVEELDEAMDIDDYDLAIETADAEDAMTTAAVLQRIIDQRCRELTVVPLANVSAAYAASPGHEVMS